MTSNYLTNPLIFIIDTLFYLYMLVIALRIIMQWAHWEYHNPLVQFIIKATQVPVKFLRQFIPAVGRWDTATIVLLFLVGLIKLILISLISGYVPAGIYWIGFLLADIFTLFIHLFTFSIIIEVILSWISTAGSYNPVEPLIRRMNMPLLTPIRKILPDLGGIDLSPLFAILGLQVLAMLVTPILTGQIH